MQSFIRKTGILILILILFAYLGRIVDKNSSEAAQMEVVNISCEDYNLAEPYISTAIGNKKWILIGDEFTGNEQELIYTVQLNESLKEYVELDMVSLTYEVIGTDLNGDLSESDDNSLEFIAEITLQGFKPSRYEIQTHLTSPCISTVSEISEFTVSSPVYVAWTIDWEGIDIKDQYLDDLDKISQDHNIPLTHFFNPRYFTSPNLSASRAQYFTDWVIDKRDNEGHAIGLHMHMFPDMVSAAGIEPKNNPRWGANVEPGYDVLTSAYSYDETLTVLMWAKAQFYQNGLGNPTLYRAGGWYADMETLQALEEAGFVVDSSGRTKYSFGCNNMQGFWDLLSTSQPYQISESDQNLGADPVMDLWEFPNNGADSYMFSKDQMISRFYDNYIVGKQRGPSGERVLITYLSHPEWFYIDKPKMEGVFKEIDKYNYEEDKGPVIYITLEEAYDIWIGVK